MQILAVPNNPYGNANDRSFKTVPAAIRFMMRSYYTNGGVARTVEVYNGTAPIIRISFIDSDMVVLKSGTVEGLEIDKPVMLDQGLLLTKNLHKEE